MASYPRDRFDDLPADLRRVGAHRGPARKGRGWVAFAWAALATGLLVLGGLFALNRFVGVDIGLPFLQAAEPTVGGPTAVPTATAAPANPADPAVVARNITVIVLNGTATADLENKVGDALAAASWKVDSRAAASTTDIAQTTVYYSDPANEDVARGVLAALGVGRITLVAPETFPGAALTAVVGSDYVAPAAG